MRLFGLIIAQSRRFKYKYIWLVAFNIVVEAGTKDRKGRSGRENGGKMAGRCYNLGSYNDKVPS